MTSRFQRALAGYAGMASRARAALLARQRRLVSLCYAHRVTTGLTHYRWPGEDSGRWLGFRFRPGDIVISTRRKTGTTWMQMICALLIFQTPELPDPLWQLSPWLDSQVIPHEFVYGQLAEQRHRRFIKTHTPLDGIPLDPRVTYIVTARHPLDTFVSLRRHNEIIGPPPDIISPPPDRFGPRPDPSGPPGDRLAPPRDPGDPPPDRPGVPPDRPPPDWNGPPPDRPGPPPGGHLSGQPRPPEPPGPPKPPEPPASREMLHDALLTWIADDDDPCQYPDSLPGVMRHLSDAWARRGDPNVLLVRYDDLLADLEGQMRWLAGKLAITVPDQAWPLLTQAATFGRMKDRADTLIPVPPGVSADAAAFFRRGSSGAGRELLSDDEMAGYYARVTQLAPPDMLEWLHSPPAR
jgi:aryl sulfotransferase